MQVRVLNISRNGKRYCYAQLVESYRRESDGMPSLRYHLLCCPALKHSHG